MVVTAQPKPPPAFCWAWITKETIEDAQRFGASSGESDWIGEPSYIVAVLALLHSRNATETVDVDMLKKNKRQKLLRKPPLFSYHMLCIPNRCKQKYKMYAADGDDDPSQIRAHFVGGHWKLRKTGWYFWQSFQRGNPALGFLHKDYLLTAGAPVTSIKINTPWSPKRGALQ